MIAHEEKLNREPASIKLLNYAHFCGGRRKKNRGVLTLLQSKLMALVWRIRRKRRVFVCADSTITFLPAQTQSDLKSKEVLFTA